MKIEYQLIKNKDEYCINEKQFISLLSTNCQIKFIEEENTIALDNKKIKYKLRSEEIKSIKEVVFYFDVEIDNENDVDVLEKFDKIFEDIINRYDLNSNTFCVNILQDDVSQYYGEKLYLRINKIENYLRKIIYIFMGNNVGKNWIKKSTPPNVIDSIKNIKNKNNLESDNSILYNADFKDLGDFLFIDYPLVNNQKNLIEEIIKIKDLKEINGLISKYEYKSNWDRYFSEKLAVENLKNEWKELYKYRNLTAHNRKIRKEQYDRAEELISHLEIEFKKCLDNINNINVPEEEQENLKVIGTSIFVDNYYNKIQETLINMPTIYDKIQSYNIENPIAKAIDLQTAWQEKIVNMPTIYDKIQKYNIENPITKAIDLQTAWQEKIVNMPTIYDKIQKYNIENPIIKAIEQQHAWQDKIINNPLIGNMIKQENTLNLIEPLEKNNKILDTNKGKDSKKDDKNDEE